MKRERMRDYGLVMYKIEAHAADSSVWHGPSRWVN